MFDAMRQPEHPVHDDYGRQIGTVQRAGRGPTGTLLWRARALEGADLGLFSDRDDACVAVRMDWALARPRDPQTRERFRVASGGVLPVYLGH
jgi:hypothetical protein